MTNLKTKTRNDTKPGGPIGADPRGKKCVCAACDAKFYDLNKSGAVCPRCGESPVRPPGTAPVKTKTKRPQAREASPERKPPPVPFTDTTGKPDAPEPDAPALPEIEDDIEPDLSGDGDVFLEDEDEQSGNVDDIIGGVAGDDEEE